jgi:NADH-quinone oxidoreductase subunit E
MGVITDGALQQIREIAAKYPQPRSALLPALHIAQNELGWVSRAAMEDVASALAIDPDQVEEVATFYTMFYTEPVGTYVLEVCKTLPCSILGSDEITDYIGSRLGIVPGETTADGMFTLLRVECLAACHRAPVMQVNHRYYQDLTPEKIDALIDAARQAQLRSASAPGFAIRKTWSETVGTESRAASGES